MKRLILVGAGHAHAQVLKDWISQPVPGTELLVVSPSALAPYSGMVPGWLAGHYRFEQICIDFEALARAAGARWLADEVVALDADRRRLELSSGAWLDADVISINIGSTLTPPALAQAHVLSLRPLGHLRVAWEALQAALARETSRRALSITVAGGGAAGVESALAVRHWLARQHPDWRLTTRLVTRSTSLLPGMASGAVRRVQAALANANIDVQVGTDFDPQSIGAGDLLLWATGAEAHAWPAHSALATGRSGFIRIDDRLRSTSHPAIHAVGDCAEWTGSTDRDDPDDQASTDRPVQSLPKAGVFAVRMGPTLSHNLRASLGQGQPQPHAPRLRYLALLATADQSAVMAWGNWSAQGRWAWLWKDHIDRRFLARFLARFQVQGPG